RLGPHQTAGRRRPRLRVAAAAVQSRRRGHLVQQLGFHRLRPTGLVGLLVIAVGEFLGYCGGGLFNWRSPGWSRRGNAGEADDPSSGASLSGWFGSSSLLSGAAERDPLLRCLGLSRKQRVLAFVTLLLLGSLFLSLSLVFLPMVLLKARRFAVLYSMGSLCLLLSFSALWGPVNHLRHLVTGPRRPFTCAYLLMLAATLYSAMGLRSGPLALLFVCLQVAALLWYLISYLPGGQRGIRFLTSVFYSAASRTAKTTLPI
ncbi:hypothetical protein BOX15_Mlig020859g1, partial [Macrostomum lignano]